MQRRFQSARWVIGACALAAAAMAACSSPTPEPPGGGQPADGPVTPKVNRVVVAMPPPSEEGNNPNVELSNLTQFQLRPMMGWLIDLTVEGKLAPMLANSWSVEPDGMSWRLKLRPGIRFHGDNGEFSAKDVEHSFKEITREESIHSHAPIHRVVTLEVVNDYEVVFRHQRPNAEYLYQLSRAQGGISIASKVDAEKLGSTIGAPRPAASTGPYQFKSRQIGQNVVFERVPYEHFMARPDFPELELRWMREASTRLASLLTEEIHITQLPQDLMAEAAGRGFKTVRGPISAQRTWLTFYGVYLKNPNNPAEGYLHNDVALADVRVRKALNKAIDRDALNKAFFAGKAEPMYIDKMPRSAPYFNPDWERNFQREYGYEPEVARALLNEAGYGPGKPLRLRMRLQNLPDYGGSEDVQEAIADFWRRVGVETELVNIQETEFRNINNQLGHKDLVVIAATSSFDIQAWRVYNSSVPPRGALELVEIDPIVRKLQATVDEAEQQKLLRELGDKSYPLHMNVPLFWLPAELMINPRIVADWKYPGSISRVFSHFENIKAAR